MSNSRWRNIAAPIIAKVLCDTRGQDEKTIRRALRDAYPFYDRRYHPYKIWCDEVRVQRGLKQIKRRKGLGKTPQPVDIRQSTLFEGSQ